MLLQCFSSLMLLLELQSMRTSLILRSSHWTQSIKNTAWYHHYKIKTSMSQKADHMMNAVFTFDVFWGGVGTYIFRKPSSAVNNTQSILLLWVSFCFLRLFQVTIAELTKGFLPYSVKLKYSWCFHFEHGELQDCGLSIM